MGIDFNDIARGILENPVKPKLDVAPWAEPEPLMKLDDPLPYPMLALPDEIRAAVSEVLDFVQCPIPIAACSALSALSLAGQGVTDVRRDSRLLGPVSLYFLSIGASGERKSTVDNLFIEKIRQWEHEKEIENYEKIQEFKAKHSVWEVVQAGLLSKIKVLARSGKSTEELEKRVYENQQKEPVSPKYPHLLYADATPEALAWSLSKRWFSGGVISSEAGIVFGGHSMGRDSIVRNLSFLNTMWDGIPLRIDRRTSESYTVQGARLTMGLAVQPEVIRNFYENSGDLARGSGFIARFLMCKPESTQGKRFYRTPPSEWPHLNRYQNRLLNLFEQTQSSREKDGESVLSTLNFSKNGRLAWIDVYNEIEKSLSPGRELSEARDVASKAADNIARLAALFAVYHEHAEISSDSVHQASDIVTWHLYEAKRFFAENRTNPDDLLAGKLDSWLLERKEQRIAKNDIRQCGPNSLREKEKLDSALNTLVMARRVRIVQEGKKVLIEVNPALLALECNDVATIAEIAAGVLPEEKLMILHPDAGHSIDRVAS